MGNNQLTTEIVSNKSKYSNSVLDGFLEYSNDPIHIIQVIYTVTCIFWLLYAIGVIFYILRRKILFRKGLEYSHFEAEDKLFKIDETLTRFSIFFIFLVFECVFCLSSNIYVATYILLTNILPSIPIPIDNICISQLDPIISEMYEHKVGIMLLNFLFCFENFSFEMMIWVMAVFLLHLSYAATNKLKLKHVGQFLLVGLVFNSAVLMFMMVPYTSILGKVAQTILSLVSFCILLYIGRYRCFPALTSGVKEAHRIHSYNLYQKKKRYLRQYKILFITLLIAFLIFLVRDLVFYNIFLASESVIMNPCWFHATYHMPYLNAYVRTIDTFVFNTEYFLVFVHSFDLLGYSFFIVVNLTVFFFLVLKFVKQRHPRSLTLRAYRLNSNQLSRTLLS